MESDKFPLCVSPDHVMGLLGYLSGLGGVADADAFNKTSGVDLDLLPHALVAAEMLGLVTSDSGYIMLTKLGKRLGDESARHARRALGEMLAGIEPFKSLVRLLKERRVLRHDDVIGILRDNRYGEGEEEVARGFRCLLSWLLYAHLVEYDPDEDMIRLPRERRAK